MIQIVVIVEGRGEVAACHILVLLDCDDGCAKALGPELLRRAQSSRPDRHVSVVLCVREFECWLIAGAEGLRGCRGLPHNLTSPEEPETIRGGKEWLSRHRQDGHAYRPGIDQAGLTQKFDINAALQRCRSLRKLQREIARWVKP